MALQGSHILGQSLPDMFSLLHDITWGRMPTQATGMLSARLANQCSLKVSSSKSDRAGMPFQLPRKALRVVTHRQSVPQGTSEVSVSTLQFVPEANQQTLFNYLIVLCRKKRYIADVSRPKRGQKIGSLSSWPREAKLRIGCSIIFHAGIRADK